MARDKLSNFLLYYFLVNLFCFFLAHKVSTNHKASAQWLRREASAVAREQIHKTFGVGHNSFQDTRHANMESVFRRTYSSPSALPSAANSAAKDADMHEEEICECVDCACVACACGGLE